MTKASARIVAAVSVEASSTVCAVVSCGARLLLTAGEGECRGTLIAAADGVSVTRQSGGSTCMWVFNFFSLEVRGSAYMRVLYIR